MKTKPLSPTLRENKRYLVFEVLSKSKIVNIELINNSIISSFSNLHGQIALGQAGLIFLNNKYNPDLQKGVVRVEHNQLDNLRSSLLMINKIDAESVIVRSVGASGILNKVKQYLSGKERNILS